MANQHVLDRITGIQGMLMAGHSASAPMSANTKGQERQQFIESFLSHALPPIYRFGTGDATDASGNRSGQLDVVIEYPFSPTIPFPADKPSRLYLAESVAAVIEVKSDLSSQWNEAKRTAELLAPITRQFGASMSMGSSGPSPKVPLYVVGYRGWKTLATLKEKLVECPQIAGILVIDGGFYCSANCSAQGPHGLWALICDLFQQISGLQSAITDPLAYIMPSQPSGTVTASIPSLPTGDFPGSLGITSGGLNFGKPA